MGIGHDIESWRGDGTILDYNLIFSMQRLKIHRSGSFLAKSISYSRPIFRTIKVCVKYRTTLFGYLNSRSGIIYGIFVSL